MIWLVILLPFVILICWIVYSLFAQDINKITVRGGLAGLLSLIPASSVSKSELPNSYVSINLPFFKFETATANVTIGGGIENPLFLAASLTFVIVAGLAANAYMKKA